MFKKLFFMSWRRSAIKEVNDWDLRMSLVIFSTDFSLTDASKYCFFSINKAASSTFSNAIFVKLANRTDFVNSSSCLDIVESRPISNRPALICELIECSRESMSFKTSSSWFTDVETSTNEAEKSSYLEINNN